MRKQIRCVVCGERPVFVVWFRRKARRKTDRKHNLCFRCFKSAQAQAQKWNANRPQLQRAKVKEEEQSGWRIYREHY